MNSVKIYGFVICVQNLDMVSAGFGEIGVIALTFFVYGNGGLTSVELAVFLISAKLYADVLSCGAVCIFHDEGVANGSFGRGGVLTVGTACKSARRECEGKGHSGNGYFFEKLHNKLLMGKKNARFIFFIFLVHAHAYTIIL